MNKYLPHIDGLRGFSILLVFLFHLDISLFSGGFIGVDIFFTISGFLVARNITTKLTEKSFSFFEFYKRRIKRLLPAIVFLVSIVLIISTTIFPFDELIQVYRATTRIFSFHSNIFFKSELSNYFGRSAQEIPLLHFWSLSIEEQFYLVFPLILLLTHKYKRNVDLKLKIAMIGVLALVYSLVESHFYPAGVYFSTLPRFYQFLFGACFCLTDFSNKRIKLFEKGLFYFSICGLVILSIVLEKKYLYPGYFAPLVTLLSVGVIVLCPTNIVFNNRPLQHIGKLSYSIYLWHWPIIVFSNYLLISASIYRNLGIFLLTYIFSLASFHFVEKPFRYNKWSFKKAFIIWVCLPLLISVCARSYIGKASFVKNRTANIIKLNDLRTKNQQECTTDEDEIMTCQSSREDKARIIMIYGDSHARHFYPFVKEITNLSDDKKVILMTRGGCAAIVGQENYDNRDCKKFVIKTEEFIKNNAKKIDHLIVSNNWEGYKTLSFCCDAGGKVQDGEKLLKNLIVSQLEKLRKLGIQMTVLGTSPYLSKKVYRCMNYPLVLFKNCWKDTTLNKRPNTYRELIVGFTKQYPNVHFLDPKVVQCEGGSCIYFRDDISFYIDAHHLTVFGAKEIGKLYLKKFGYAF